MVRFWVLVHWVMSTGSLNTVDVVCINPEKYENVKIVLGEMILVRRKGALKTRMAKILEVSGDKFQLLRRKRQINTYHKGLQHPARVCNTAPNAVCVPKTEQGQGYIPSQPSPIQQVFIDEEEDNVLEQRPVNNGRVQLQSVFLDEGSDGENEDQPVNYRHNQTNTLRNQIDDAGGLDEFLPGKPVYFDDDYIILEQPRVTYIKSKRSRFSQRSPISTLDFQRHHPTITNYFENKEQANASELSSHNTHEFTRDLGDCNSQTLISPSDLFEEPQTHHAMICSTPMPKSFPNEYSNTHKMNQAQQTDTLQENSETNTIIDDMEKQIHVLRSAFCELSQSTANREVISCFPREVFDKMANLLGTRERMNANGTSEAEDISSGSADESTTSTNTSVVGGTHQARPPRARRDIRAVAYRIQ